MSSLICVKSGTISIGEINRAIQTGDCYLREFAVNTIRPTQYSFWIVLRCVYVTVKSFPQQPYNSAQCRSVRLRAAHADFSQQQLFLYSKEETEADGSVPDTSHQELPACFVLLLTCNFPQQFFGFSSVFKCLLHVPFLHPSNRKGTSHRLGKNSNRASWEMSAQVVQPGPSFGSQILFLSSLQPLKKCNFHKASFPWLTYNGKQKSSLHVC